METTSSASLCISAISTPAPSPEVTELWKRSELIKFEQYLKSAEEARLRDLTASLARVKRAENQLKLKLLELENKERDLAAAESDLKRTREEVALKLKRQNEHHASSVKLVSEQHAVALKIEKDKLRAEEARRKGLELELASRAKAVVVAPLVTRQQNRLQPTDTHTADLQLELRMKEFELQQALERERLLTRSRDHFRTIVLRQLGPLLGLSGDNSSSNQTLMRVDPSAIDLLAEQEVNPVVGSATVEDRSPVRATRLQQKRAELISSGIYREGDDVIVQLDSKISKAINS